jgi:hypothetical protein
MELEADRGAAIGRMGTGAGGATIVAGGPGSLQPSRPHAITPVASHGLFCLATARALRIVVLVVLASDAKLGGGERAAYPTDATFSE